MEKSEKGIMEKLFEVKKAGIKLQRDTSAFNYKYATLSQIQEKLSSVMQEQKLIVVHYVENNCVTTEIHDIEYATKVISAIPMSEGTTPQDKGKEITYYRRYNLLSLLDLETEDDDGASASGRTETKKEQEVYVMTTKDVDNWNGKIYGSSVYIDGDKKTISQEQITKLKAHDKFVELPPKK